MSNFSFNYGIIQDLSFDVQPMETHYTLPETIQILSEGLDGKSFTFTLPYASQVWNINYITKPVEAHTEHKIALNKMLGI